MARMSESGPARSDRGTPNMAIHDRPSFPYAMFVVLLTLLAFTSLFDFLLTHSIAEVFGVAASLTIAAVVLNSRGTIENNYLRILGVSYLFTAVIEMLHMLAYRGIGIFPDSSDLPTQLWLAFRSIQAVTLVVAPLAIGRKLSWTAIITGYALVTSAVLAAIFLGLFPSAYVEPTGLTPFKIHSEYLIIGLAALGGILLFLRRSWFDRRIHHLLMAAVVMFILAELMFTLYGSVYSAINTLGHLFMLAEYFLVFMAIVHTGIGEPTRLLYRELRDRERRFRGLVENARDVLFQYQMVPERKLIYISPVVQDMVGYSPEELYRDPYLMSRQAGSSQGSAIDAILSTDTEHSLNTVQVIRRDGEPIWMQVSTAVIRDEQGQPVMIAGISRDVTETVHAFEQLRLAQHKLQLLGSLTNHDLRNHITTAAGYLELAGRSREEAKRSEHLAKSRASLMDMNALLDSTKRYYDLGQVPPAWLGLRDAVFQALLSLDMEGLDVQVDLLDVEVYADEMLVQVFHNLVHNTVNHGRGATTVRFRCEETDEGLHIIYEDDGPGVPVEDKEAIFEWKYGSRRGHGLHFVSEVLAATGMNIREAGEQGEGALFVIMVRPGGYRFISR